MPLSKPIQIFLSLALCFAPLSVEATTFTASAHSYMLVNRDTGQTLYAHNADAPLPPASLTKIMTLFLAFDALKAGSVKLREKIKISRAAAATGGSSMRLLSGERVPFENLLAGMAVASGNDAAVAVAQRLAKGDARRFVTLMNRKAAALEMRHTLFKTPNGLPALGQQTTARDMATLAGAYLRTYPAAAQLHILHSIYHRGKTLQTTNTLLGMEGVDGLKTGWTQNSGYNIVVTAQRNGVRLLIVVMGAKSRSARDEVVRALLKNGFHTRKR